METSEWTLDKQIELCDAIIKGGMAKTTIQQYFVKKCKTSKIPLKPKAVKILRTMIHKSNIDSILSDYIETIR